MTPINPHGNDNLSKEPAWGYLIAPPLILLAPLIVFIDYHGLLFSSPEILLVIFGTLLFGLACGAIIKILGSIARVLAFACLLEFSLDLIGDFEIKGKIICAIAALLFSWIFREKAPKILTLVFSVFIAATLIFPSQQLSPTLKKYDRISGKPDLPPVIHLILDGHIGVEGIPGNLDQGRQLKKDVVSFYEDNGFRLYGNAYSHFDKTLNSVSSLLNFDAGIEADKGFVTKSQSAEFGKEMIRNKYFKNMSGLGYQIKVYQFAALNYCQEDFRIGSCYTYQTFSTRFLQNLSSSVGSKMRVILTSYLMRSEFFRTGANGYWHLTNFIRQRFGMELPYPLKWNGRQTSPIGASLALEKLRSDIKSSAEGTLFFAHLLVPHDPFIYDSNCQIYKNPISEWSGNSDPAFFYKENSVSSRAGRYKKYFQQVTCLNRQLQDLFDAMRSSKIFDDAIIIIHGDHGSRIRIRRPNADNQNDLTPEDYLDSFSALFAVKTPDNQARYDLRVLSLNQIFSQAAGHIFNYKTQMDTEAPYIYLRKGDADEEKRKSFLKRPFTALAN